MDFDYDLVLNRLNLAVDKLLHAPGPLGSGLPAAIEEISNTSLVALPKGEIREMFKSFFAAAKGFKPKTTSVADADEMMKRIFALRDRIQEERRVLRLAARLLEETSSNQVQKGTA